MKNIYIFARVNTKSIALASGNCAHVAAAYNKCLAFCKSFASQTIACTLVTTPVVASLFSAVSRFQWVRYVEDSSHVLQMGCFGYPPFDRLYASLQFLWFVVIRVRANDTLILYNFFPEYIPAAILAKIRGLKVILDVEDAPRIDEVGFRGFVNRISFSILRKLQSAGFLTVSTRIVRDFSLKPALVVYGAVPQGNDLIESKRSTPHRLVVNYGGAILPETGLDLFAGAIDIISQSGVLITTPIHFYITGFGETERLRSLLDKCPISEKVTWDCMFDISMDQYSMLLVECNVGLCLKDPAAEMGTSTFPSKVLEIASNGLMLISSKVSDVPQLFANDEALLLDYYTPQSLAQALLAISNCPTMVPLFASKGAKRVENSVSYQAVGLELAKFLNLDVREHQGPN